MRVGSTWVVVLWRAWRYQWGRVLWGRWRLGAVDPTNLRYRRCRQKRWKPPPLLADVALNPLVQQVPFLTLDHPPIRRHRLFALPFAFTTQPGIICAANASIPSIPSIPSSIIQCPIINNTYFVGFVWNGPDKLNTQRGSHRTLSYRSRDCISSRMPSRSAPLCLAGLSVVACRRCARPREKSKHFCPQIVA